MFSHARPGWMALLLLPSLGMSPVGRLRGTVTDTEGNPVKDVLIEISGMDIKRNYRVKTDKKGKYLHVGVSLPGIYRLVARKKGYEPAFVEGARPTSDPASEETGRYDFTIRKGSSERQLAFELSDEERAVLSGQRAEQDKRAARSRAVQKQFDAALESFEHGNYEEAIAHLHTAIETDATQSVLWTKLGQSYEKLNRPEEALSAYEKASALQPDFFSPEKLSVYQNMGKMYAEMGEMEKARTYWSRAIELSLSIDSSLAASTYYNIAVHYINLLQNEPAIELLEKATAADATYAEAYYQLGVSLLSAGRTEEALRTLAKYIEMAPDGPNLETAKTLLEEIN